MQVPGISTRRAVSLFNQCGFYTIRSGKHIIMKNEHNRSIAIPRSAEINSKTMSLIIKQAGYDVKAFVATFL